VENKKLAQYTAIAVTTAAASIVGVLLSFIYLSGAAKYIGEIAFLEAETAACIWEAVMMRFPIWKYQVIWCVIVGVIGIFLLIALLNNV